MKPPEQACAEYTPSEYDNNWCGVCFHSRPEHFDTELEALIQERSELRTRTIKLNHRILELGGDV